MSDYIERDKALAETWKEPRYTDVMNALTEIRDRIRSLPSADVQPVVHGKWLLNDNQRREDVDNGNYLYFCNQCMHSDLHAKSVTVPYCWNCGAKMDGKGAYNVPDE